MYLLHITQSEDGSLPEIQLRLHVDDIPQYAILSHRWGRPEDEPNFQDLMHQTTSGKQKKGYQKIVSCCLEALKYGVTCAWVDTCCIDKSSSAELSEAINSMYAWYEASRICFAYMEDVPPGHDPSKPDSFFQKSSWFKRGWTLQELIAPDEVVFFDTAWNKISSGSRSSLSTTISLTTGIPQDILNKTSQLQSASVAQKMSWAASRQTTRVEDEAYSLMGIFGVNMPTVYGEGKRAFRRLQEEIMKHSPDHTIFAWGAGENEMYDGMLATSPRPFRLCGQFQELKYVDFVRRFRMSNTNLEPYYFTTNYGLQIQLPLVSMSPQFDGYYFAFLAAIHAESGASAVIFLRQRADRPQGHFSRVRFNGQTAIHRVIPEEGYYEFAPATKLLVSGNEPAETGLSCMPRSYATLTISLVQNQTSPVFIGVPLSVEVQQLSSSDFTTNETSNICRVHLSPEEMCPAKALPITGLTQGQHVAALIRIHARPPLRYQYEIVVAVTFGLQGEKPWVFVDAYTASTGNARDDLVDDMELMALFSSFDLFGGHSIWEKSSKSISFLGGDRSGMSKEEWWTFGVKAHDWGKALEGSWRIEASIERMDTFLENSYEYILHFQI